MQAGICLFAQYLVIAIHFPIVIYSRQLSRNKVCEIRAPAVRYFGKLSDRDRVEVSKLSFDKTDNLILMIPITPLNKLTLVTVLYKIPK